MRSTRCLWGLLPLLLVTTAARAEECTCDAAKLRGGWCGHCEAGYVAGIRLAARPLYDALQGERVEAARITCEGCKTALKTAGACEHCHLAFARDHKYTSVMAQRLARGEPQDPAAIQCAACRTNAERYGWCDKCNVGMVQRLAFRDKEHYEQARRAYETLAKAAKLADKCSPCAVAMVTDGTCRKCEITYKDGKKVAAERKEQTPAATTDKPS